jgi:MFS family permease
MALPPEFDQPAGIGIRRLDHVIDRGQARVFRWMWFMVPPSSIARNPSFQALLASRFLSDLALQALLFGVLIASARGGGSAFEAAMIGVAFLVPGVALGLFGGAVADALPKRFALIVAYLTMGALCLALPLWLGFELRGMLAVLFAVRVLHQVSQPSEASAVPMVATHEELASANSFLSLMSSAGEVVGKALLAPLIVTAFGIEPVVVVAGLLFMLSATRVIAFRVEPHAIDEPEFLGPMGEPIEVEPPPEEDDGHPRMTSTRDALRWLINEPAAFWMLALAAMASTTSVVLGVLGPQYVRDVLNVDPKNTFYVFAPASLGLIAALVLAPLLIKIFKERLVAAFGFLLVALGLALLGTIDTVVGRFADTVLIIGIPGVGEQVEMAAAVSTLLGMGMTLAAAATQTYIGKYVPSEVHGRIFALLGAMKDGLAIPVLLSMGLVARWIGVDNVLLLSPIVLVATAFALDGWLGRWRTPPVVDGDEPDEAELDEA